MRHYVPPEILFESPVWLTKLVDNQNNTRNTRNTNLLLLSLCLKYKLVTIIATKTIIPNLIQLKTVKSLKYNYKNIYTYYNKIINEV